LKRGQIRGEESHDGNKNQKKTRSKKKVLSKMEKGRRGDKFENKLPFPIKTRTKVLKEGEVGIKLMHAGSLLGKGSRNNG